MRRIDLADSVGLSPSAVTRLLAPMEKPGLVEKEANPRDARVSLVKLSTAGAGVKRRPGQFRGQFQLTVSRPGFQGTL